MPTHWYHLRIKTVNSAHGPASLVYYAYDLSELDLFLYYVHPISLGNPIIMEGIEITRDFTPFSRKQVVRTDYSLYERAKLQGLSASDYASKELLFEKGIDVTPQVFLYYQDSPVRLRIENLLLRIKELEATEAQLDSSSEREFKEIEQEKEGILDTAARLFGSFMRGYMGP